MEVDFKLSVLFAKAYNDNKQYIPDTKVVKIILLPMYERFVKEGLTPIEDLPLEKKIELVNECKANGKNLDKETLIQKCKILYLLKSLNETETNSK